MNYLEKCKEYFGDISEVYLSVGEQFANPWPIIDEDGFINIYTSSSEASLEANKLGFSMQALPGGVLCDIIKAWEAYGISKLRFHKDGVVKEIKKGLFEDEKKDEASDDNFNSSLQYLMIRFMQAQVMKLPEEKKEKLVVSLWKNLCEKIPKTLFFMPIVYDDDDLSGEIVDNTIHVYDNAAKVISYLKEKNISVEFENFPYYNGEQGKTMMARSLYNNEQDKDFLSVYTDFHEMMPFWKNKARIALVTYEDIKKIVNTFDGFVINPMGIGLIIPPEIMELIDGDIYAKNNQ